MRIRGTWKLGGFAPVFRVRCLISAFLLAISLPAGAFNAIIAFGDSYTDVGNLPSSPPNYWAGRFSNGPLWIEYLSQSQGFVFNGANDFAVSGSESEDLGGQIATYPGTLDTANTLFAIWSGNNDFANHLDLGTSDSAWNDQINNGVASLIEASDLLYQKGARNVVLFNLMDLTRTPAILNHYTSTFRSYLRGKINTFNSRLSAALPNLLNSHPGLQVYYIDIYSDFNYLLANYSYYGFTQATIDALDDPSLSDTSFGGPGANYVFWDNQHPSTKTHGLIADWVGAKLPAATPPPTVTVSISGESPYIVPATLQLAATVDPKGWTISQVNFFANGQPVGQSVNSPYAVSWSVSAAGSYAITAHVTYGSGQTVSSDPTQVTVAAPAGSPPPAPWNHQDIGPVGQAGSARYSTDGTFTVIGSGADIWEAQDDFQFAYQAFAGDGSIVARVTALQNTDGFAKACVMFRASLDADAANAMEMLTASAGLGFQARTLAGEQTSYTQGSAGTVPYWVKLEKVGTLFRGYSSPDGTTWTLTDLATVSMGGTILVGLGVTAHNDSMLNTSMFASVQISSTANTPPVLAITRSNGTTQLQLTGAIGASYRFDASTDLMNWIPISTNVNASGTIQITDSQSADLAQRFYRAALIR